MSPKTILASLVSLVALVALSCLVGCSGEKDDSESGTEPAAATPAAAPTLPEGWKTYVSGREITLIPKKRICHIRLREAPDASAPADVLPGLATLLRSRVEDFEATSTEDMEIAGRPAKHVFGTGREEDGDDSNAEVFVFSAGGHVYVLCLHGEGHDAAEQRPAILPILNTAKAP